MIGEVVEAEHTEAFFTGNDGDANDTAQSGTDEFGNGLGMVRVFVKTDRFAGGEDVFNDADAGEVLLVAEEFFGGGEVAEGWEGNLVVVG